MNTFGIREFARPVGWVEEAVEAISVHGYTVLPDVLAANELEHARTALNEIYLRQLDEVGGDARLRLINDLHTVRAPLGYDDFFLEVATKAPVLAVVRAILGDYVTLMLQNGVLNEPMLGHEQNGGVWHRDLNYQHFVSSRPLSISALFCIDRFSEETGGTVFLPHSHRVEAFPSNAYVQEHQCTVEAPAGAVVVFDSMIFHRGGLNRTGAVRRGINHMYTLPLLQPQISFPRLLAGRHSDDPFLRQFLGYDSVPAASPREFRELRISRISP
jgi:ectoine hydroxylase-related dioxygenase (phytanoyl-CoA dioxygenase family)